jgi:archaetidylinositol phosphate synthase
MDPTAVTRENTGVLAAAEKQALVWLAERMPLAVNSDHLTALGAGAMVAAGVGFALGPDSVAGIALVTAGLGLNWFGDSLDGTLARARRQQRPRYGYYVDHVLDTAGMLALFSGMGAGGYLSPIVALATLVAYYVLAIEIYLATHALGTFRMSFWSVGPTELRVVVLVGTWLVHVVQPHLALFGVALRPFDLAALVGAAGLLLTAVRSAVINTRVLYRAEPLPSRLDYKDGCCRR